MISFCRQYFYLVESKNSAILSIKNSQWGLAAFFYKSNFRGHCASGREQSMTKPHRLSFFAYECTSARIPKKSSPKCYIFLTFLRFSKTLPTRETNRRIFFHNRQLFLISNVKVKANRSRLLWSSGVKKQQILNLTEEETAPPLKVAKMGLSDSIQ